MTRARFADTLQLLAGHNVEFIVVGMTAGILQGVPLTTIDVDILHRRTPANVEKLLGALTQMQAQYRHDPRKLSPTASHLIGPGNHLLSTSYGDLDCLGTIGNNQTYDDLLNDSVTITLASGKELRVLSLPRLIEMKRQAGRPKDIAALPHLEATLDELLRRG